MDAITVTSQWRSGAAAAAAVGRLLVRPVDPDDALAAMRQRLDERPQNFLRLMSRGVYDQPASPYRALLEVAGCQLGDLKRMMHDRGLEGALRALKDAGVYVAFEEFKGRRPIVRHGREIPVTAQSFDNPLLRKHYEGRTGGTRGVGGRLLIDPDLYRDEAASHWLFLSSFDLLQRPMGLWRPALPGVAGMQNLLRQVAVGRRAQRWFSQHRVTWGPSGFKYALWTACVTGMSRLVGRKMPWPRYAPMSDAGPVVRWLVACTAGGRAAWLDTSPGSAVRLCQAAQQSGLDIAGTLLRLGGEPFTDAKARVFADAGCDAVCHYSMSEIGRIGIACRRRPELDDVHLLTDKLAVITHARSPGPGLAPVNALMFTTLLFSTPKLMLNVESDDHGCLERRDCGCPMQQAGLHWHLHTIRSYDKLTTDGMQFSAAALLALIETVLPQRFGGGPTDYQFAEQESAGRTTVCIVVSPRVGAVDEAKLIDTVLDTLAAGGPADRMMAQLWRDGQTLSVARRDPAVTSAAKIMPLVGNIHRRSTEPPG